MNARTAEMIRRATLADGGGTFAPSGASYSGDGYAVAMVDGTFATVDVADRDAFTLAVLDAAARWPHAYIGTWRDGALIHIDPAEVIRERSDAVAAARARRQLALYDLGRGEEVRLA